ncbi:MAG: hypothetical protein P8Y68_07805, partial [Anaerolineales bacterium]
TRLEGQKSNLTFIILTNQHLCGVRDITGPAVVQGTTLFPVNRKPMVIILTVTKLLPNSFSLEP